MNTLGDDNIRRVLADPPLIWSVVAPDEPGRVGRERKRPRGLLARLFGRKPAPADPFPLWLPDGEGKRMDLDKAWHGIHYLLTGTSFKGGFPLNFLVLGGEQLGHVEVGYGPARVFTSAQVREIAAALAPIDETSLRDRFNPDEMMKLAIYPAIWDRDPADDDTFAYCAEFYSEMKAFVADAAERGVGLVVSVT